MHYKKSEKGFTLIELLVVIAIIGILSSVVLASLNDARRKSRDARRVSDIKQLQLALEFFFDANRTYPNEITTALLVTPGYIAQIPTDPTTALPYVYIPVTPASGAPCTSYHIGAILEDVNHSTLDTDLDGSVANYPKAGGSACLGGGTITAVAAFAGDSAACTATAGTDQCFDVAP